MIAGKNNAETDSVSIFSGELTRECFKRQIQSLEASGYEFDNGFVQILLNRLLHNNFSDKRLVAAVQHAIDTIPYRKISIADIISFDTRIKLYTYDEYCDIMHNGTLSGTDFEKFRKNGTLFWVKKSDLAMYNLTIDFFKMRYESDDKN